MDFIFWHDEKVSEKESIIFCSFVAFAIKTLQNVANKTSDRYRIKSLALSTEYLTVCKQ